MSNFDQAFWNSWRCYHILSLYFQKSAWVEMRASLIKLPAAAAPGTPDYLRDGQATMRRVGTGRIVRRSRNLLCRTKQNRPCGRL